MKLLWEQDMVKSAESLKMAAFRRTAAGDLTFTDALVVYGNVCCAGSVRTIETMNISSLLQSVNAARMSTCRVSLVAAM